MVVTAAYGHRLLIGGAAITGRSLCFQTTLQTPNCSPRGIDNPPHRKCADHEARQDSATRQCFELHPGTMRCLEVAIRGMERCFSILYIVMGAAIPSKPNGLFEVLSLNCQSVDELLCGFDMCGFDRPDACWQSYCAFCKSSWSHLATNDFKETWCMYR